MFKNLKLNSAMQHWWLHRLSAILMFPLIFSSIFIILKISVSNYNDALKLIKEPYNLIILIFVFSIGFWHVTMGMQVIFEDYVSNIEIRKKLLILLKLLTFSFAIVVNFCIISIFFR